MDSPSTLEEYRSISCVGVMYKVIYRLLTNRMSTVLLNLIADNQGAFIKGRRISYYINLTQEFTQSFNYNSISRRALVTINFCKAFDMLRWDSIDIIMESLGFGSIFRDLVMACVKSASFSAMVEGPPTEVFQAQRGVRQGYPLSPLLFVFVIEYLTCLTNKQSTREIRALHQWGGIVIELILAFADDAVFFY